MDIHVKGPIIFNVYPADVEPGEALTAILTIGGSINMPANITVDQTGQASVQWIDDKGDVDAPAPPGAVVSYQSDNPAVATVDANSGQVQPVAEGSANISATIADSSGNPILEPSGQPFSVQPAAIQIVAGTAVGAGLEVQAVDQPPPAPTPPPAPAPGP